MKFGDRLKKVLDYKGMTAADFAQAIGKSPAVTTHYVKNRNMPEFSTLERIHELLPDINFMWLLFGEGEMLPSPAPAPVPIVIKKETPSSTNVGEGGKLAGIEARLALIEQAIGLGKSKVLSERAAAA